MKKTTATYHLPEPARAEFRDATLGEVVRDFEAGDVVPADASESAVLDRLVDMGLATRRSARSTKE